MSCNSSRMAGFPELPEVGVCFETAASYESLTYLGRGPQENYSDRQAAADIGLYNIPIDEMYVPYLRPQENGARTDVRFASLQGEKRSLRIESVEENALYALGLPLVAGGIGDGYP